MTVIWQSPALVYATTPTTLIGAVVTPLLSRQLLFEWYELVDGAKVDINQSGPFVRVPAGTYSARVTYVDNNQITMLGHLSVMHVLPYKDLFQGNTVL